MYVTEFVDGRVEVKYVTGHTGHELGPSEIKHLPLPGSTREEVAMKISVGVPSERILDGMHLYKFCPNISHIKLCFIDVRETVGDRTNRDRFDQSVSRKHFLTNRDINNIRMRVKDSEIKRHENDAISVAMIVAELKEEPFDPILIFKPQSIKDLTQPTLPTESFLLAFQTQFQMELYRKHASTILCIDSTHGINQYRFKLITCIVPDELGKGKKIHASNVFVTYQLYN